MGEQHDSLLAKTFIPNGELHGHRALAQTSQGVQPGDFHPQGEQRWHRRHHLVTQGLGQLPPAGMTACGQQQPLRLNRSGITAGLQLKTATL